MPSTVAGLIDVHHHAVPPVYVRRLADIGVTGPVQGQSFPAWDPEASLDVMDAAGITACVLSVTAPGLAQVQGAPAQRLAREVNEYLAELVARHPTRFGAFALMPMDDVAACRAELRHALDVLHLDGVGLFTSAHGRYLGDPTLDSLMAELAERRAVTFVHPSVSHVTAPTFGLPESVIEFPIETTRAVVSLLHAGTLDRHPTLQLILSHAGGTVPYLARRMTLAGDINPSLRGKPPRDVLASLRLLYYDVAMSATHEQLSCLIEVMGADRILFGSDYPFMPAAHAVANADGLRAFAELGAADRTMVEHGSAIGLFPRFRAG